MSTHINSHVREAKLHLIEAASSLHMIASDIRKLANDNEIMKETGLQRDKLLELVGNLNAMATDATYLGKEIDTRIGFRRWPEIGPSIGKRDSSLNS